MGPNFESFASSNVGYVSLADIVAQQDLNIIL